MLNDRLTAARRVTQQLRTSELAFDAPLLENARMIQILIDARNEAKLSPVIGQDVLESTVKAQSLLIEARGEAIRSHYLLKAVRTQIGLDVVSIGALDDSPEWETTGTLHADRRQLQLVETNAA